MKNLFDKLKNLFKKKYPEKYMVDAVIKGYNLSEKNYNQYYSEKFSEIPLELWPKIKEVFDKNLNEDFINRSKILITAYGLNQWMTLDHFSVGMAIRNLLRDNGITDNLFPDQNLDDYYVVMLEWWLGYRILC